MTNIAWRNLAGERTRFAISVAGVAFSVVLVLILRGLYRGVIDEATSYVRNAGAELWVAQAGIPPDFLQATSVLPGSVEAEVRSIPGVAAASPLLSRAVAVRPGRAHAATGDLFLIGADAGGTAGWPAAVRGHGSLPKPGDLVLERVFAKRFGLKAGDILQLRNGPLRVSRVVTGGNAFVYQFGWANLPDVDRLVGARGVVSYVLVHTAPGSRSDDVARSIVARVRGTQVFTAKELADKNAENLRQGFLPILWVLMIVAFVVGTAIIGLIIYTATVEKTREFGILKAIGFSNRRLYAVVLQQSFVAATTGFVLGCALSFVLGPAVQRVVPVFVSRVRAGDVVFVAIGAVVMSVLASVVPARPVARLDPAQVFKH